jgi:hypothetical protein
MKLILNRREEQEKKLFKTSTMYYLDIKLEFTQEEVALIRKHKWDQNRIIEYQNPGGNLIWWSVGELIKEGHFGKYTSVEELAYGESQVIENAKKLKQQLEAAAGYTSGGPREIEL